MHQFLQNQEVNNGNLDSLIGNINNFMARNEIDNSEFSANEKSLLKIVKGLMEEIDKVKA